MASSSSNYSDLVQATKSGRKVQELIQDLRGFFEVDAIGEKDGYSKVECHNDELKVLDELREQFKIELLTSKKVVKYEPVWKICANLINAMQFANIIKDIVPQPEKNYYLSTIIRLLVFQSGLSDLEELVDKDDCIILIPVLTASVNGSLKERATGQRIPFTFETESELVISGRCSIHLQPQSKAVCVVLSIGRDKE
ncbi:hypothetical protein VE02_08925 [Pseudogymnoascus sp. 03VT05]|nr:hypothetical protein VE02_08925 [Pseudogymnoascus sp. 03VT05]